MIIGTDFQKGGISVFVVSDQEILRQALVHLLRVEADYTVIGDSGVVGVESVAWSTPPAVVLIHAGSEIESLIELVQRLKSRDIPAVILLHERHPWLVHAFRKAGAFGLVLLEGRAAHLRNAIYAGRVAKSVPGSATFRTCAGNHLRTKAGGMLPTQLPGSAGSQARGVRV
jgi:DNA-binding NarL/FixJ family response regulator